MLPLVFNFIRDLPTKQDVDHAIYLLLGTTPINVYHFLYYKNVMEKLVQDLLAEGRIHHSHSIFSNLTLLVEKKEGSWHLCVGYKTLN